MIKCKTISFDECEIKFAKSGTGEFEGYASVYGNVDSDGEIVGKGAFAEIAESQRVVPIFYGHSWRSGW